MGPWRPLSNGSLIHNPLSWTTMASMVFLEQPVGVGFSYSIDQNEVTNDYQCSVDNLAALKTFFQRFPERRKNKFYLAAESYGGHYIPQWTLAVLNDPDPTLRKSFSGFLLGNPYVNFGSGSVSMANSMWGMQVAPAPLWWVAVCFNVIYLSKTVVSRSFFFLFHCSTHRPSSHNRNSFVGLGCDSFSSSAFSYSGHCWGLMEAIFNGDASLNPCESNNCTITPRPAHCLHHHIPQPSHTGALPQPSHLAVLALCLSPHSCLCHRICDHLLTIKLSISSHHVCLRCTLLHPYNPISSSFAPADALNFDVCAESSSATTSLADGKATHTRQVNVIDN